MIRWPDKIQSADAVPQPPIRRPGRGRKRLLGLLAPLVLLGGVLAAPASREYDLKAVFLYNFATFVDWPEPARLKSGEEFVIGILGDDPFGGVLNDVVEGEQVHGSPLVVRRCHSLAEAAGCRILFVAGSGAPPVAEIVQALRGRPVLTVGDGAQFVEEGGIVGFSTEGGRLHLHINAEAARTAGLSISSKLLRVATVHGEGRP